MLRPVCTDVDGGGVDTEPEGERVNKGLEYVGVGEVRRWSAEVPTAGEGNRVEEVDVGVEGMEERSVEDVNDCVDEDSTIPSRVGVDTELDGGSGCGW